MSVSWSALSLASLSGLLVALGLFYHVAGIVREKRTMRGILLKISALFPLFFAVRWGLEDLLAVCLSFFVVASITLVFLTLARNKLLR